MSTNVSISRHWVLRRGAVATGALAAVALLCVFYSIVASAVSHAAQARSAQRGEASVPAYRPVARAGGSAQNNPSYRGAAFGPRSVSYVRFVP